MKKFYAVACQMFFIHLMTIWYSRNVKKMWLNMQDSVFISLNENKAAQRGKYDFAQLYIC